MRRGSRRVVGVLALVAAGLVGGVLALEALLRAGGWAVGRWTEPRAAADGHRVVLCVGDSHTYGMGKGYPAMLATLLAERSPDWRVVNLGVPGSNTAQVRRRFLDWLDTFRPVVVIHWAGINNNWNRADADGGAPGRGLVARALDASRLVRFVRVWRAQSELREVLANADTFVAPALDYEPGPQAEQRFHRRFLGADDRFEHRRTGREAAVEEMAAVTAADVEWMAARARERGIPMVVIAYPFWNGAFGGANDGIRRAAKAANLPLVESSEGIGRLRARWRGREKEQPVGFDESVHPTQALYDEIARLVLETLDRERLLPPS